MVALLTLLLALALRPEAAAAGVLAAWDERRSAAYAAGDPAALRELYLPGSATGAADGAALGRYAGRGLRVTGLRTQLLAVTVVSSRGDRLVLRVTDRMAGGVARGGGVSVDLPRDRPSHWRLSLVRASDGWRVGEVLPQRRAVASTASTSGSRNR